jgi:hypothetical protein
VIGIEQREGFAEAARFSASTPRRDAATMPW